MTRRTAALLLPALALLVVFLPEIALACSVCGGSGTAETRWAFRLTTLFMSVLPLVMVGGIVGWLWRRARALESAPARPPVRRPAPAASPVRVLARR